MVIYKPIDIVTGGHHSRCILNHLCTNCGEDAIVFNDAISEKEYSISGFCQSCQDKTFSIPDDEEDIGCNLCKKLYCVCFRTVNLTTMNERDYEF